MPELFGFILKVLTVSALISIAIKQGGTALAIPTTTPIVVTIVCLPTLLVAIALVWRWQHTPQAPSQDV